MRRGRVAAFALATSILGMSLFPADSAPAIKLIAHRGGADLWPENTMLAFRNAHAMFSAAGVPGWLELDTQFTSDKVLVVMHDATLDRTTNCSGPIVEKSEFEVTQCDADPGPGIERVPTLARVMTEGRAAGWRLMVEIKDIPGEPGFDADCMELADALKAVQKATGFPKQNLVVQSFWPPCLDNLELKYPKITRLLLTLSTTVNDVTGLPLPVPVGITLTANVAYATLHRYEYSAADQDAPDFIGPVVRTAHLLGRMVVAWTVDDAARMKKFAKMGVDGIISNRPDLLISTLAS
jgi:glycerophosphoryl diester phosphodiesterase